MDFLLRVMERPIEVFRMGNDFIVFRFYNHSGCHIENERREGQKIEMVSGNSCRR